MNLEKTINVTTVDEQTVCCLVKYEYTPKYQAPHDSLFVRLVPDEPEDISILEVLYHDLDIQSMVNIRELEDYILNLIKQESEERAEYQENY